MDIDPVADVRPVVEPVGVPVGHVHTAVGLFIAVPCPPVCPVKGAEFVEIHGERHIFQPVIVGFVRLKGTAPVAILHLKDTGRNYYVSRGDVIRITENGGKSAAPLTEAYVVIKDVRDEEVELVQQERPDKVIIVR